MGLFDHMYHLDWTAKYPLEYYYDDEKHVTFDKYEIDMFGGIYNKKKGVVLRYRKCGKYDRVSVFDNKGKRRDIYVARAVVSTFHGPPPTTKHTAEHIDCTNKDNDIVCELTWMDPSGQVKNRVYSGEHLSSLIIVRDDLEMTAKGWAEYLKNEKNSYGNEYTEGMISQYARKKQHEFSYKIYDDLPDETWYKVLNSESSQGHWEISDQNRIAYLSKFARNVIDTKRFGLRNKYPTIKINGKNRYIHDVAFETFYPDVYNKKLPHEMILHKLDDKLDFRPHMLYIGDASTNGKDSHNNECHNDTKTSRKSCCSYVDGVFEKRHDSLRDAAKYLKSIGYIKADYSTIGDILESDEILKRYGRTWSTITMYT